MTPRKAPKAAAIYCRISQDGEGSGLGVKRQEEDCRKLAKHNGWPVAQVYVDNDLSAFSGKRRPSYEAMLDDLRNGRLDALIAYNTDRLTRQPRELEDVIDLAEQAQFKMATCQGDIDLATEDGRFMARITGAYNRKESEAKSRRIRRKHEELARDGKHPGSWAMLGYEYDVEKQQLRQVRSQAAIVKRIFQMYADGAGLREIARWVEDRGTVGVRDRKRWTHGAITRILDNPTYAGMRRFHGELFEGTNFNPIVSKELWQRVSMLRAADKAKSPAANREGKGTSLLSGVIYCTCGQPMWRDTYKSHDERSYYVCRRSARKRWGDCREGGVSALRAERVVTQELIEAAAEPYATALASRSKSSLPIEKMKDDDVELHIARTEAKLDRLLESGLEKIGPDVAKRVQRKAETLQTELDALRSQRVQTEADGIRRRRRAVDIDELRKRLTSLPKIWEAATTRERNQLLRLAIERVTVSGTGRPKNLSVEWADWLAAS
jgi:site-specific DNA recombinase